jgi:hypothetical protein
MLLNGNPLNFVFMPLVVVAQDEPTLLRDDWDPNVIGCVVLELNLGLGVVEVFDPEGRIGHPDRFRKSLAEAAVKEKG